MNRWNTIGWVLLCCMFVIPAAAQNLPINTIGGFEGTLPSYWTMGNAPGGSTLSWATDQSRSMGRSLKITKSATSDSASWISENMCDIWSPRHYGNVDMLIGAYVRTSGVNISPANADESWYVSYSFYDSAGVLIMSTMLPIDQSVASSSGWVADTNGVGETILPKDSWKTIIKFVGGKNATGTVWADDFMLYGRAGAWAGQDWNASVGVPTGWNYWLPPNGGNDGLLSNGFENTRVTNEASHSGAYSLKFDMPFDRAPHDAWVGTRRYLLNTLADSVKAGDVLRISMWLKGSSLAPDSAAMYPGTWAIGVTPIFHSGYLGTDNYDEIGAHDFTFTLPNATSFEWAEYFVDVTVPSNSSIRSLSVRPHVYSRFTGTVYYDDITVTKLNVPGITGEIGSFEGSLPSYWTMGNAPGGSTLSWATDQSRSMGRSLKITKSATSDSASWISENMCDIWSPRHYGNVDMLIGAYVRTSGVNISPANADESWYVSYSFYDSAGVLIMSTMLPIDQSVASSSGWVADTNGVGETILPKDSWKTIIKFVGGKNATGTVWADDFMLYGRAGAWAGQDWNASVGVPTGWNYWLPPNGGNDGLLSNGFENTRVTNEASHSGAYSLKFDMPFDRAPHDAWVGTRRYLLNGPTVFGNSPKAGKDISQLTDVKAGDVLRISMWLKGSSLAPDSAAMYPGTWAIGVTPIFHTGYKGNDNYDEIGAHDFTFTLPNATSFEWTQYYVDVTVPNNAGVKALSIRPHVYSRFTGTVYYDDVTVTKLDVADITSTIGGFEQSLPSYWTMGNAPGGSTLSWATDQSRSMGRSLKITKSATSDSASWISENMCDIWSPRHYGNVDMLIGAYVRTSGVNISPANADESWYVSYSFYDSAGVLIMSTMLPIDQSVASSSGWVADTNGVGETILPKDSWKTIIKFVGGKNATGTVWADDFMLYGRAGAWAGQDWNASVGVPTGWNYWLPPNGGNDGLLSNGFENTRVTNEASHSGAYSLKFDMPFDRAPHDAWVGTRRYLLNGPTVFGNSPKASPVRDISQLTNINAGDILRISMWLKGSSLAPDSAAMYPGTWAIGVTPIFHTGYKGNDNYDEIGAHDFTFTLPNATSFEWTQYSVDVTVPSNAGVKALSIRPHVYSRFTGTVYYDDVAVQVIGTTTGVTDRNNGVPKTFELANNFPNPFNPTTVIRFGVPSATDISIVVYNVLGQKVRALANGPVTAGFHEVTWDGHDDLGTMVQSGVYFYRMQTGSTAIVKKMLFVK